MKKLFLLLTITLSYIIIFAQNPNFKWAERIGADGSDNSKSITSDIKGNLYVTGSFFYSVDFDPGPGTYNLVSPSASKSTFVLKLDSFGNLLWAKKLGGRGSTYTIGSSIVIDAASNVYITGCFTDTTDFDPGIDSFKLIPHSGSGIEGFITKLDSLGNFVWAKQYGSTGFPAQYSIALDGSADIYVCGYFYSTADFNPNAGTYNMTSKGKADIFVCKLDSSGNFIWARQIGGKEDDIAYSLDVDIPGNVYLTGSFKDTCDLNPGSGVSNFISLGKEDIFIVKLTSLGDFVWARQIGGSDADVGNSLKLDKSGKVYIGGGFRNTAYLYPSVPGYNVTSAGKEDIFIAKFDTSGNINWLVNMGGDSDDVCNSLAVDAHGSIYSTGKFQDTADFNPNSGVNNLISTGMNDIFIFKIDSVGNYKWAKQIGGTFDDEGASLIIDSFDNLITTGDFSKTADFDPGVGVYNLTAYYQFNYKTDVFIQKMKQCSNSFSILTFSGCDSIIVNNQIYKGSGVYTQSRLNTTGCDSTITINIIIRKSTYSIQFDTACDSLRINGIKYLTTGIYSQKISNSAGCDSNITLNVFIKNSTVNNMTIISCNSYKLNNQLYTSSGLFFQNLVNSSGCDSTIRLDLLIKNIDTTVTKNNHTLTANLTGANYQWIDCKNNLPIPGETNQNFIASSNGSYAVIITKNSCTDTSSCFAISGVGINFNRNLTSIQVYPNPVNDKITIEINEPCKASIILLNAAGETVVEKTYLSANRFVLDLSSVANGIYVLEIDIDGMTCHKRIAKFN